MVGIMDLWQGILTVGQGKSWSIATPKEMVPATCAFNKTQGGGRNMKVIEAMKQMKILKVKCEDLRKKVAANCADLNYETPLYGTEQQQAAEVRGWIQAHHDCLKELMKLWIAIQRTNLQTTCTITLGEKNVTKTVAEWVLRRRELAGLELAMWRGIGDRNLKEGVLPKTTPDAPAKEVKIRRYYDPQERDKMVQLFTAESTLIDSSLEVSNATTDLMI